MSRFIRFSVLFVPALFSLFAFFFIPGQVSAHEVYVLDSAEISLAMQSPTTNFLPTISQHLEQFATWGIIVIAIIFAIFFLSVSRPLEKLFDPYLIRLKKYAPHLAQITLGLALAASGYYHAIFGVELPLGAIFGSLEPFVAYLLIMLGMMLVFGILPRVAAILTTAVFLILTVKFRVYMLNYCTYLGEALTIALFGGAHTLFKNNMFAKMFTEVIPESLHKYKFLIMRVFFGMSLIYASLYAKFIHGALALEVVSKYHLTQYFHFDPVFLVLGAMLIEVLLGLCFAIGFEIRFASLFFLVFLTMSLVFFGEAVWPHIILIGTAISMFLHGYDSYTMSVRLEKDKSLEPVM